jgi:threonine/homoserine/homoserine lactone efflux protein
MTHHLWLAAETVFWVFVFFGALATIAWIVLCLIFAAARRSNDRYKRRQRATNHRVGGNVNPEL